MEIPQQPSVIYKFRDWNAKHGKDPLEQFELFFSSPSNFNDPFDSKIKFNYSLFSVKEKEAFIDRLLVRDKNNFDKFSIPITSEGKIQIIKQMMNDEDKFQLWAGNLEEELINKIIGIISFSTNWNNVLMWSHYASNHTGYCIGLDEQKLRETHKIEFGGKVIYPESNTFPSVHPLMDEKESFFKKFFTKSIDWKYEEEYRILNIIPPEKSGNSNIRKFKYDSSFISDITLGLKISDKASSEIIEICKKYNIKVYQAFEKKFKFEVDRKEICT